MRDIFYRERYLLQYEVYFLHTDLFFCSMLHAQNLFYIHILYTQKGMYSIFEYKKNFEREAFRFSMIKIKKKDGPFF